MLSGVVWHVELGVENLKLPELINELSDGGDGIGFVIRILERRFEPR